MYSFVFAAVSFAAVACALDGIVVPETIAADTSFNATFQNGNSDQYRVYLAAALAGANGPTCYLINSTDLSSPVNLSIPATVGPSASYYSIAVADVTTSQGATYSNRFNFTGGTGNYTEYENHLGGASFWSADALPCSSYECARECAQASYPEDLTSTTAYDTMKSCILKCPGVSRDSDASGPVSNTASGTSMTVPAAAEAEMTLTNGDVITAIKTTLTTGKSTITEAIIGSKTLTLGGAEATISSEVLSLGTSGIIEGSTSTVAFTTGAMASFVTGSASSAASSSTSSAAAPGRSETAFAGLAGIAGLAAFLL